MSKNLIEELEDKPSEEKKAGKDRPINVFAALFFLTLGIVFLLNNFDILPWSIWSILWRFWPLFLIMAALQILARKSWIASVLVFGLGVGVIATVIVYSLSLTNQEVANYLDTRLPVISRLRHYLPTDPGSLISNKFVVRSDQYEDIDMVIIDMNLGAGTFAVEDTNEDHFVQVNADYYEEYGRPDIQTEQQGNRLIINIGTERRASKFLGGVESLNYNINLGKSDITKQIKIRVGAGKMTARFDQSDIQTFSDSLGAGKETLVFAGDSLPQKEMDLEVGAGSMNVTMPPKTFAKFIYAVGVGVLNVNGDKYRGAGDFTMKNFSISEDPLPINVNIGAGTININI